MNLRYKICVALSSLFMTISVPAQNLPALATAPELETGSFPNGIRYYLVTNKAAKGYADYTLVQKVAPSEPESRAALVSLPHFMEKKPYDFLASKGVGYSSRAYLYGVGDASVFRFADVPTSDAAASDSTLMMIFDLCTVSPYEQAVVISGDIDAASVKGKMSIFSMMVPMREKAPEVPVYEWKSTSDVKLRQVKNSYDGLSSLTVRYASPRTPASALGTVQVLVAERMYAELGTILDRRLHDTFAAEGIVLGSVETKHEDSASGSGDESYSVTVNVGKGDVVRAASVLAGVLANLDRAGVSPYELADADACYVSATRKPVPYRTNEEFSDLCVSSFLYGTSVRSTSAARDFFAKRSLPADKEAELFNGFVSALFDSYENLSITVDAPDDAVSRDRILDAYMLPWSRTSEASKKMAYIPHAADTLKLAAPGDKVKMKSESADPVTGGTMWTFSNGIKVVYKNVKTMPGQFRFMFLMRGGYGSIPNLGMGEGAFASDVLYHFDVAGMSCGDFNMMLKANGIELERKIGVSDMRLEGSAPSDKLLLVVKSIASFANFRRLNQESYDRYLKSEPLRIEMARAQNEGLLADVDALMRPDYKFTQYKYAGNLSAELPDKLDSYLATRFHNMNDGVIMVVGDLPADQVLKVFTKYAGSFGAGKVIATRSQSQYQLKSSIGTCGRPAVHQDAVSATVAMSVMVPVTAERFFAFKLAQILVQERLAEGLKDGGLWAQMNEGVELSPAERFSLTVTARPLPESGLPEGILPCDASGSLTLLREALSKSLSAPVTAPALNVAKSVLAKQLDFDMSLPVNVIDAAAVRYSDGKDLYSKYKEIVGALSPEAVQDVMASLDSGCKVEYVMGM